MPSVSKSQQRLMAAASHDPKFAKKVGIDQDTAKEWNQADKKAKTSKKDLPEHVGKTKKSSNETYTTTASISGPRGFKDQ